MYECMEEFGTYKGYYLWFRLLEVIGKEIRDKSGEILLRKSYFWSRFERLSPKILKEFLFYCTKRRRLLWEDRGEVIWLKCPKLLDRADTYTKRMVRGQPSGEFEHGSKLVCSEFGRVAEIGNLHVNNIDNTIINKTTKNTLETKEQSESLDYLIKIYREVFPEQQKMMGKKWIGWLVSMRDRFHAGLLGGMTREQIEELIRTRKKSRYTDIVTFEDIDKIRGGNGEDDIPEFEKTYGGGEK